MLDPRLIDLPGIDELKAEILPPALIRTVLLKNCAGKPLYEEYEIWVVELANASKAFMVKTNGEAFWHGKESCGEADARTRAYDVDFKLVLGQAMLWGLRDYSYQLVEICEGVTTVQLSRRAGQDQLVRLHVVLRDYNKEQLRSIYMKHAASSGFKTPEENVARFLKSIDCSKNVLLILPELIYSDASVVPRDVVAEVLYREYGNAVALRRELQPGYDTFLAYFCEGDFVILEAKDGGFNRFDEVPVSSSPVFMDIVGHYDPITYGKLDELLGLRCWVRVPASRSFTPHIVQRLENGTCLQL